MKSYLFPAIWPIVIVFAYHALRYMAPARSIAYSAYILDYIFDKPNKFNGD